MGNRSFEMYQYRQIITQMRLGQSDRAIKQAQLAGRDKCKQVREIAIKHGWLSPDNPLPEDFILAEAFKPQRQLEQNTSLAKAYEQDIEQWYQQGIHASTMCRALIHKHSYAGSYDSVRRFVKKLKVKDVVKNASCILYFAPAEAAQVDFGKGVEIIDSSTGEIMDTWFFVMTLCYSRHMYVEFVRDQTVETWLGCHRRAFEFFGGVPQKVIIDNPKCAIIKACRHDPQVQRSYGECAEGYGFMIAPCPPRDPKKKGIVESGVKYVKGSFLPLRNFRSLADANQQALVWVLGDAGNRTHGTTYQKPLTLFHETEKHLLSPLPTRPPELVVWVKAGVHGDCHVQHQKCRYSIPFRYIGQEVWLRVSESCVQAYYQHELMAIHIRLRKPGQRATLSDHLPPNAKAYLMRDATWCRKKAEEVGQECYQVIQFLFADKVLEHLRAVQGILSLAKIYGATRLNAACKRALLFNSPYYKTIKGILKSGVEYDTLPDSEAFDLLGQAYTQGRFIRESTKFIH